MSNTKFCNLCNRNVQTKKNFSLFWFVVPGLFTMFITSLAYAAYYTFIKTEVCPMCDGDNLSAVQLDEMGKKAVLS